VDVYTACPTRHATTKALDSSYYFPLSLALASVGENPTREAREQAHSMAKEPFIAARRSRRPTRGYTTEVSYTFSFLPNVCQSYVCRTMLKILNTPY
jgi:hypothetical protein